MKLSTGEWKKFGKRLHTSCNIHYSIKIFNIYSKMAVMWLVIYNGMLSEIMWYLWEISNTIQIEKMTRSGKMSTSSSQYPADWALNQLNRHTIKLFVNFSSKNIWYKYKKNKLTALEIRLQLLWESSEKNLRCQRTSDFDPFLWKNKMRWKGEGEGINVYSDFRRSSKKRIKLWWD